MMPTSVKCMIVNWRWDEDLFYPQFAPQKYESPNSCSLSSELNWIPVVEPESVIESTDQYILKKDTNVDTFIIPTKVIISYLRDSTLRTKLRTDYLYQMLEAILNRFPKHKCVQVLFLFHKIDGFDVARELSSSLDQIILSIGGSTKWQINVGFFGGGSGILYDSKGFLSMRSYFFRYRKRHSVGWFQDTIELQFLEKKYFQAVWEYYWYQTRKRLLDFRHLMDQMQIPEIGDSLKPKAKRYTKNLLHHLHEREDHQFEQLEYETWDFSECVDLANWLSERNKNFPSYQSWIEDLKKFANNEHTDFSQLNKGFIELTESLHV